ncbi:hypothetical protein L209DRAFT_747084, partial [Thermothelomyces heterothallicus CBS 203.75]
MTKLGLTNQPTLASSVHYTRGSAAERIETFKRGGKIRKKARGRKNVLRLVDEQRCCN